MTGSAGPSAHLPAAAFQPLPHLRTCLPASWPTGSAWSRRPGPLPRLLTPLSPDIKGPSQAPPWSPSPLWTARLRTFRRGRSRSSEPAHLASYCIKQMSVAVTILQELMAQCIPEQYRPLPHRQCLLGWDLMPPEPTQGQPCQGLPDSPGRDGPGTPPQENRLWPTAPAGEAAS